MKVMNGGLSQVQVQIKDFKYPAGQDNRVNDELWGQLGGKQPYIDEKVIKDVGEEQEPRLFHGSNASGNFKRTHVPL